MTELTKWQRTKSNIQLLSIWLLVGSIPFYGWYAPIVGEAVSKLLMGAAFIFIVAVAVLCGDEKDDY